VGRQEASVSRLAFWRASEDAFSSSMGTRKSFLGWYLPGIGHPLFSYPPFDEGNGHQPRSGPGPASLNSGYGSTHRSINSGVPLGKGTGVF
jgi:hypothetical protein